jgi:hypothetical protein
MRNKPQCNRSFAFFPQRQAETKSAQGKNKKGLMPLFEGNRDPFQGIRDTPLIAVNPPPPFHLPQEDQPYAEDQQHGEPVDQDCHPIHICEVHFQPFPLIPVVQE